MISQEQVEKNSALMIILVMLVISVGGLVEIVPLYYIDGTIEDTAIDGKEVIRPYTPLEQRGRDLYIREGCYNCHSQMVRPFRDEMLRYGHYSLGAESKYDHPFQWGSKRTGPDLARVGGKYSNEWHTQHMIKPTSVVPQSIMPNYPWLAKNELDTSDLVDRLKALKMTGVPYSLTDEEYQANVKTFGEDVAKKLDINKAKENLMSQATTHNYDGNKDFVSEMDAMVAYLQVLGTMVDFSKYDEGHFAKFRTAAHAESK